MRVIHGFLLFVFALSFLLSCHSADGERYERVLSRAEQQNRAYDSITHVDSIHMAARWTDRHGSANERVRAPSRKEHPLCATILEESSGAPWKLTWYDACGRETATESVGEDGIDQNTYTAYNSRGLISGKTSVNGAITTMDSYTYDDMGRVASKSSTTGTSATYTYSNHSVSVSSAGRSYEKTYDDWGNILTASDPVATVSYTYNSMGKPISVDTEDAVTTMEYDDLGNQTELCDPDAGTTTYEYDAMGRIDNDNLLITQEQQCTYNALGKVDSISQASHTLTITYGPDGQRWRTVLTSGATIQRTTIYAGDYEQVSEGGITRHFYYLDGGVVYVRQSGQADKVYYAFTDHQGSIVRLYDSTGSVFESSYTAWGDPTVTKNTIGFHRGYTGHEHLTEFGLINMNGRLYDPFLCRFLSPDNYVQAPDNPQNFNRYSYCLNNPLKYTDPSGELFGIDDAFLIFSVVNSAMMGAMQAEINGGSSWKGALRGAAIATLSTIGTADIGQVFGHTASILDNELLRAVAHGVNGGAMSWLKGLDVGIGGITSAFASLAGSGAQALSMDSNIILAVTTLSSSITSFFSKGNLMDGAMAGLNIGMLNHGWKKLNNEWVFELDEVIVTSQYGFGHHAAIPREKGLIGVYPEFIFLSLVRGIIGSYHLFRTSPSIQFGRTDNQIYHTFRHTDKIGLERRKVKRAVLEDLWSHINEINSKPYNRTVFVNGRKLQYNVFKIDKTTYNIGRIHEVN